MGVLWAEHLFELSFYSFEAELSGSSESKSIPSIFRRVTETFFGNISSVGRNGQFPKDLQISEEAYCISEMPGSLHQLYRQSGAAGPFAQLNEVGWKNMPLP